MKSIFWLTDFIQYSQYLQCRYAVVELLLKNSFFFSLRFHFTFTSWTSLSRQFHFTSEFSFDIFESFFFLNRGTAILMPFSTEFLSHEWFFHVTSLSHRLHVNFTSTSHQILTWNWREVDVKSMWNFCEFFNTNSTTAYLRCKYRLYWKKSVKKKQIWIPN